jgi:hypothetical protein
MAEKEVRKTTAKKTVRRTTTKVAPRKTAVRKTAAAVASAQAAPSRKAPARTSPAPVRKKGKRNLIAFGVFIVAVAGSVAVGYSDKGQIDITSNVSLEQNTGTGEQQTFQNIPVQQTQNGMPNGGLVGSSDQSQPAPQTPELDAQATSTSDTATSTDSVDTQDQAEGGEVAEEVSAVEEATPPPADTVDTQAGQ